MLKLLLSLVLSIVTVIGAMGWSAFTIAVGYAYFFTPEHWLARYMPLIGSVGVIILLVSMAFYAYFDRQLADSAAPLEDDA